MESSRWSQLEGLFLAAAAKPVDEREAFLRHATDDESLRAEVRELLAHDTGEQARTNLASSLGRAAEAALSAHDEEERWSGRTIGAYRVVREIGRGGMGVVLLAERSDGAFDKQVAIKLSLAGLASPALAERLESERRILATLDHSSIARLVDGGTTDEGVPYVVMDYVEGTPIDAHCGQAQLDVRARLELFLQVCDAVEHAHRALVVHRDLKPANILVTREGRPKLLDFGIAKLLDPDAGSAGAAETRTLMRALTPEYASPEQVLGEPVTTASDVYALGVVLFELLTGTRPFALEGSSAAELERVVTRQDPPRPSSVPGSAVHARRLEGDLDNIVLKALRKEPGRRYAGVRELAEDIRRHLEGHPVAARPSTIGYRVSRFVGRHRVAVAASLVALLALAAGLGYHATRLADERDRALLEADKSARIADYLVQVFTANDPNRTKGEEITARALLDRGAETIDEELADEPLLRIELLTTMARAYRSIAEHELSLEMSRKALALVESEGLEESLLHSRALSTLSASEASVGNDELAAELSREALAMLEGLPDSDTGAATQLENLASLALRAGRYEESEQLARQAHARRVQLFGADDPRSARSLATRAQALRNLGRLDEARPLVDEVLEARLASLGEWHGDTANTYTELSMLEELAGNLPGAAAHMERAVAIHRKIFPADHPALGRSLANMSGTLLSMNDFSGAEVYAREALEVLEAAYEGGHRSVAQTRSFLSSALIGQGRYEEGLAREAQSVTELCEQLGAESPSCVIAIHNLATNQHDMGAFEDALERFNSTLGSFKKFLRPGHHNIGFAHASRGKVLIDLHRIPEAREELERARAIVTEALNAEHPAVGAHLMHLGRVEMQAGRFDAARSYLDESLAMRRRLAETPSSIAIADTLHALGELALLEERWAEAQEHFEQALGMREDLYEDAHFEIALSQAGLARAQWQRDARDEATRNANAALAMAREIKAPPHRLGQVLAAHGHITGSRASLEEAATLFARCYPETHPLRVSTP